MSVEACACICNTICVYDIRFARGVEDDLYRTPVFSGTGYWTGSKANLRIRLNFLARDRKLLENLIPPWDAVPPVLELRVGEYRVFYDVSEEDSVVYVRAIRRKPKGKTTEEIL